MIGMGELAKALQPADAAPRADPQSTPGLQVHATLRPLSEERQPRLDVLPDKRLAKTENRISVCSSLFWG